MKHNTEILLIGNRSYNCDLNKKYKEYYELRRDAYSNVSFQIKLSVHTPFDEERKNCGGCHFERREKQQRLKEK